MAFFLLERLEARRRANGLSRADAREVVNCHKNYSISSSKSLEKMRIEKAKHALGCLLHLRKTGIRSLVFLFPFLIQKNCPRLVAISDDDRRSQQGINSTLAAVVGYGESSYCYWFSPCCCCCFCSCCKGLLQKGCLPAFLYASNRCNANIVGRPKQKQYHGHNMK